MSRRGRGATPTDTAILDAGLAYLAARLAEVTGTDGAALLHTPGMGAAGGLPASLSAVLGAEIVPGSRLVADAVGRGARRRPPASPHLLSSADL